MTNPKQMRMTEDLTAELNAVASEHPEVTPDDDVELSEELADTATIETLLDTFISEVGEMLSDALEVSLEGNPVRTHIELQNFGQDTIELAYMLKRDLTINVAVRAEEIPVRGNLLRTQVVEETVTTAEPDNFEGV